MLRLRALLLGLVFAAGLVAGAGAQYSSGGYSRPSSGGSSSFGSAARRPPVSSGGGGYARPYGGGGGYSTGSGGDRAFSRSNSAQSLQAYRSQQQQSAAMTDTRRPSPWGTAGGYAPAPDRRPTTGGWPSAGYAPQRSGVWDAVMAWSLLNAISSSNNARYFQQYQADPGYRQWRMQADQMAAQDPAVAAKLRQLDSQLAQPAPPPPSSGGSLWLVLFVLLAAVILLWVWRRRAAARSAGMTSGPSLSGSAATRFRVGMTMPLDPSPFLLAAGLTKVTPPEGGALVSVEAIGLLSDGRTGLNRLYLPGRAGFFQLHLGRDGMPDECRWFSQIDEVTPASNQEWAFWLDPAEGMVGWPQFQTKDGKTYGRVWAPGNTRIPPQQLQETLQDLGGVTRRTLQAMLYGAPTGAPPPAPQTEYILVCVVEAGGQAWVEIHAGIDINPAALTLPPVPLS